MTATTLTSAQNNTSLKDNTSTQTKLADIGVVIGRIALAAIFLLAGMNKIEFYDANLAYLTSGGLPGMLLPAVIFFEITAALALIVGFKVRLVALALAGFSVVTAALYHSNLADQMQFIMFFKNIAMAGGFLVLAAHGAGRYSVDNRT